MEIGGKTMIQRVYEQCQKASTLTEVIVATDDTRILDHVIAFGGKVKMTASHHLTGTDRIAEVAASMEDFEIIVNIQGDEPFIHPQQIESVLNIFEKNEKAEIATGVKLIENQADIFNPNVVKCGFGRNVKALLFARSPIPFLRNEENGNWPVSNFYKHFGMKAFRRKILLTIIKHPPST